jgi:putative CRISPR-associated protein (TIGR02619 family)
VHRPQTLICTVGTSLLVPNLAGLKADDPDSMRRTLAAAYAERDWDAVAVALAALPGADRLCGAEINSLASLFAKEFADPRANLYFCHSATADGRVIGRVLRAYYRQAGHPVVETREIDDLQDADPKRFRTAGLRNLAKAVCKIIRDHGAASCAINATGGYKAQIAIAVLMGQALGVPVYYKHERFDEIIAFPPMPVALDFEVWMRLSGLLFALELDGVEYLDLSPTGQIFHETFRQRFRTHRDAVLPPPVPPGQKQVPRLERSGHLRSHPEIARFLEAVTSQVPQVRRCTTSYFNPDLPEPSRFRDGPRGIEGIYSDGTYTVKFRVETTAHADGQRAAVVAALNEWLACR